jgi:hypothetical protein
MVNRIPLDINCSEIAREVKLFGRDNLWKSRSNDFPFYTLGASAYLDGNTDKYYAEAKLLNPYLFHSFFKMYQEITSQLSNFFGEWVVFNPTLALPGFHIFPADPKLLSIAGNWHLDTPHSTLCLGDKDACTFTVAIELPTGGGGIDVRFGGDEDQYVEYDTGEMLIHSGMVPHRIASYREYVEGDYRITLQGHIIRDGNDLVMFW